MVRAPVGGLAGDSSTRDVRPKAGLVPPMEGASGVGGHGRPSGVGVSRLLQGNDGRIVVVAKGRDGVPVCW